MLRVIAFTGEMGSGKTTAATTMANILAERRVNIVKFAGPLYDMQTYIYSRIRRSVPYPKDRKLLQWLGTEWGRSIDENLWTAVWKETVEWELKNYANSIIICDDCRYDNEAQLIKDMGGKVLRLETHPSVRGQRIQLINTGHPSEQGIKTELIDKHLNNSGSLYDLENRLRELVSEYNI